MTIKAQDLMGPRPGTPCTHCHKPILINDHSYGGKGDYWHYRCYLKTLGIEEAEAKQESDQYYSDQHNSDQYNAGYQQGYEHGKNDGLRISATQDQDMIERMRARLDKAGVPAMVDHSYGVGQAGRLAWLLDHTDYIIQEIGNPDALVER